MDRSELQEKENLERAEGCGAEAKTVKHDSTNRFRNVIYGSDALQCSCLPSITRVNMLDYSGTKGNLQKLIRASQTLFVAPHFEFRQNPRIKTFYVLLNSAGTSFLIVNSENVQTRFLRLIFCLKLYVKFSTYF